MMTAVQRPYFSFTHCSGDRCLRVASPGPELSNVSLLQKGNQQQDYGVFHAYDLLS